MSYLISVIIPTYNHGKYIYQSINSVIKQTYQNWEIIVVDNFSEDETESIINDFNNAKIKYFKYCNDGIIAKSRNFGIKQSIGDYIAFLDSDDWWEPNKLKVISEYFKQDFDFFYHDVYVHNESKGGLKKLRSRKAKTYIIKDLLINGNYICNSSVVVKKEIFNLIGGMSECPLIIGAEDYNFWMKISKITNKFKYIPLSLTYYRIHQLGNSRKNMTDATYQAALEFITELSNNQLCYFNGRLYYISAKYFFDNNLFDKCFSNSRKSLINGNLNIKIKAASLIIIAIIKFVSIKLKTLGK